MSRQIAVAATITLLAVGVVAPRYCFGQSGLGQSASGQSSMADRVLRYPVPDALVFRNGARVSTPQQWPRRRAEIFDLFASQVYGRAPKNMAGIRIKHSVEKSGTQAGNAKWKQIAIRISKGTEARTIHVLLFVPEGKGPFPVFVGLNFTGNQSVDTNPEIPLPELWKPNPAAENTGNNKERLKLVKQLADEKTRGSAAGRWQVEKVLSHGYALATAFYGDIEPDSNENFADGIRPLFLKAGATEAEPGAWGALGAWAWGLSRIADYLETDKDIDAKHIALIGHSRLGKAALWSAAQDQRFALVVSNESGVGGASLYRASSGETIEHLNTAFPHWFSSVFHEYTGHPDQVPVDGNLLLALIAPRPLYVASAEQDATSNPAAEFYSTVLASSVYHVLGKNGLEERDKPAIDHSVMKSVGYHERSGKHDVTAFDWDQYLTFADIQFGRRQ